MVCSKVYRDSGAIVNEFRTDERTAPDRTVPEAPASTMALEAGASGAVCSEAGASEQGHYSGLRYRIVILVRTAADCTKRIHI